MVYNSWRRLAAPIVFHSLYNTSYLVLLSLSLDEALYSFLPFLEAWDTAEEWAAWDLAQSLLRHEHSAYTIKKPQAPICMLQDSLGQNKLEQVRKGERGRVCLSREGHIPVRCPLEKILLFASVSPLVAPGTNVSQTDPFLERCS